MFLNSQDDIFEDIQSPDEGEASSRRASRKPRDTRTSAHDVPAKETKENGLAARKAKLRQQRANLKARASKRQNQATFGLAQSPDREGSARSSPGKPHGSFTSLISPTSSSGFKSPGSLRNSLVSPVPLTGVAEGEGESHLQDMRAQGIGEVFDPNEKVKHSVDMSDMRKFLDSPMPEDVEIQCYILRSKNKKVYQVYLKETDEAIMSASKRKGKATSNYRIFDVENPPNTLDAPYIAKLRANFQGTQFVIFDGGKNPMRANKNRPDTQIRSELCAVTYEPNIFGHRGPRKMGVYLPKLNEKGVPHKFPAEGQKSAILRRKKCGDLSELSVLLNRSPKWNEQVKAYVLNFNGRVTEASVKNFQLVSVNDDNNVLLQFGRVGTDKFTMDFKHPFTPLQAFAICLSSFDQKLACE